MVSRPPSASPIFSPAIGFLQEFSFPTTAECCRLNVTLMGPAWPRLVAKKEKAEISLRSFKS